MRRINVLHRSQTPSKRGKLNPESSMKTSIKNLFLLPALIAGLGLIPAGRVTAQIFTTLRSFTGGSGGVTPYAGLIISGNTLYGTAYQGGSGGGGTMFALNANGTGFTNLHSFNYSCLLYTSPSPR